MPSRCEALGSKAEAPGVQDFAYDTRALRFSSCASRQAPLTANIMRPGGRRMVVLDQRAP
eukprot:5809777-Amphidinium_carterae.1